MGGAGILFDGGADQLQRLAVAALRVANDAEQMRRLEIIGR